MLLHKLKPAPGSRPPKRIVGRGEGSTLGQTAGRGQKGQSSRAGDTIMNGFEGGQTPLMRRIPKRGFRHASRIAYEPINFEMLEKKFDTGAEITSQSLYEKGLVDSPKSAFKVLAKGKLKKSFTIKGGKLSQSASDAIKKSGGKIETN